MGKYSKAKMFNRKAASKKSRPNEIIKTLNIHPGQTIADIGSGGGFFTFLFSQIVGQRGKIYAVDTNKNFLEFIDTQAIRLGLTTITTIQTTEQTIPLPAASIDLLFVRSVYHHLQNRPRYFSEAKKLLKPEGRIAIIEYNRQGSRLSFHRRCGHNVPQEIIIAEMKNAGYSVSTSYDFLPIQSFTVFVPTEKP
jgi:ubiquinone/menaquinone biosynthesis C-methylase UbiE